MSYFTFTNHAVKHKKLSVINITVCLGTPQKQDKKNQTETIY